MKAGREGGREEGRERGMEGGRDGWRYHNSLNASVLRNKISPLSLHSSG